MNKKPLLLRTVIAVLVVAIFAFSTIPLKERDFYVTFKTIWKNPNDPVLTDLVNKAKALQAVTPGMYQSEALLKIASEEKLDFSPLVEGKNMQDNRDVMAEVRKRSAASIRRGLDLNGGAEFVLRLVPDEALAAQLQGADSAKERNRLMDNLKESREMAVEILRKRMESQKIFETEIYPMGADLISLRVPVVSKEEKLRLLSLIKMSAQLKFALVHENSADLVRQHDADPNLVVPGYTLMTSQGANGTQAFYVSDVPAMTGDGITDARPYVDQFGQRRIMLRFNSAGAADFGRVTSNNVGRQLAIVLDGKLYCAPQINDAIMTGSAEISGRFSTEELKDISDALVSGGMKYQLTDEAVFDTDPTLGADNVRNGVWAGILALIFLYVFLLIYYRFCGVVASIALTVNVILVLGALAAFDATLTLPGIAGIILSIGMAVDINVLIYERIREEMAAGKSLGAAVDAGYARVLPVILDANLTGFLTAMILLYFGTGAIKGFAVTMAIGILTSIFTGVFLTRLTFDYLMRFLHLKKLTMLSFMPPDAKINYLKYWKAMLGVSALLTVITFAIFAIERGETLGVDFTGGTVLTYDYREKVPSDALTGTLNGLGFQDPRITYKVSLAAGGDSQKLEILLRENNQSGAAATDLSGNTIGEQIMTKLNQTYPEAQLSGGLESIVSGQVGWEFSKSALFAIAMAFCGIALYISLRYEFAYAMAGIVALIHDVIIAVGIFLLLGREISLIVIAAVLTIIGYSINDTIVVFDRIRENLTLRKELSYYQIINLSLNQTMSRTLLTSLSTLLVLVILLLFGGIAINDFILVMLLGILIGTYSSIFIASPLVALWHRKRIGIRDGVFADTHVDSLHHDDSAKTETPGR